MTLQDNNNGSTALILACRGGHIDTVRVLLDDARLEINLRTNKVTIERTTPACLSALLSFVAVAVRDYGAHGSCWCWYLCYCSGTDRLQQTGDKHER